MGILALTATNGAIVVFPFFCIAVAAIFTIRSNVTKIWKDNYEAKVEELKVVTDQRDREREQKHELKGELATQALRLQLLEAKTDLGPLAEKLDEQQAVLKEILSVLRNGSGL